jgi:Tfp pilus assembly major pilin PilA
MAKETVFLQAINNFVNHPIILLLMIAIAIISLIIGILSFQKKYTNKKRTTVRIQQIEGSNNVVSGGDMNKENHQISNYKKETKIKKQLVIGNGNKVAGGDINE